MVAENADFRQPRTFALAVASYKLAILVAKHKKSSYARIGTFNTFRGLPFYQKRQQEKKF